MKQISIKDIKRSAETTSKLVIPCVTGGGKSSLVPDLIKEYANGSGDRTLIICPSKSIDDEHYNRLKDVKKCCRLYNAQGTEWNKFSAINSSYTRKNDKLFKKKFKSFIKSHDVIITNTAFLTFYTNILKGSLPNLKLIIFDESPLVQTTDVYYNNLNFENVKYDSTIYLLESKIPEIDMIRDWDEFSKSEKKIIKSIKRSVDSRKDTAIYLTVSQFEKLSMTGYKFNYIKLDKDSVIKKFNKIKDSDLLYNILVKISTVKTHSNGTSYHCYKSLDEIYNVGLGIPVIRSEYGITPFDSYQPWDSNYSDYENYINNYIELLFDSITNEGWFYSMSNLYYKLFLLKPWLKLNCDKSIILDATSEISGYRKVYENLGYSFCDLDNDLLASKKFGWNINLQLAQIPSMSDGESTYRWTSTSLSYGDDNTLEMIKSVIQKVLIEGMKFDFLSDKKSLLVCTSKSYNNFMYIIKKHFYHKLVGIGTNEIESSQEIDRLVKENLETSNVYLGTYGSMLGINTFRDFDNVVLLGELRPNNNSLWAEVNCLGLDQSHFSEFRESYLIRNYIQTVSRVARTDKIVNVYALSGLSKSLNAKQSCFKVYGYKFHDGTNKHTYNYRTCSLLSINNDGSLNSDIENWISSNNVTDKKKVKNNIEISDKYISELLERKKKCYNVIMNSDSHMDCISVNPEYCNLYSDSEIKNKLIDILTYNYKEDYDLLSICNSKETIKSEFDSLYNLNKKYCDDIGIRFISHEVSIKDVLKMKNECLVIIDDDCKLMILDNKFKLLNSIDDKVNRIRI